MMKWSLITLHKMIIRYVFGADGLTDLEIAAHKCVVSKPRLLFSSGSNYIFICMNIFVLWSYRKNPM